MGRRGIILDDTHYYRLEEIAKYFAELLYIDVTPLLIERIKRKLNNSESQSTFELEDKSRPSRTSGNLSYELDGNLSQDIIDGSTNQISSIKNINAEHLDFNQVNYFIDNVVGLDNTALACRHILLVYEEIELARQIEMRYLKNRLQRGEICVCLAHGSESDILRAEMIDNGIDFDRLEKAGKIETIAITNEFDTIPNPDDRKFINALHFKLVKLFASKRPPFAGFGLLASEQDLKKPECLNMQLRLEHMGKKRFENFNRTWICPYPVDDIFESLEKDWMKELILAHDAVIYVRRNYSAIALRLS